MGASRGAGVDGRANGVDELCRGVGMLGVCMAGVVIEGVAILKPDILSYSSITIYFVLRVGFGGGENIQ